MTNDLRERMLGSPAGFAAYMTLRWGGTRRAVPAFAPMNTTLKSAGDIARTVDEVHRLRLPPCEDTAKTWDTLGALQAVVSRFDRSAAVLDAGAEKYSRLLPWLYLYGFRNLRGNNLVFESAVSHGPIRYEPGDLTRTPYRDGQFDAVTCLSVIEHGVDLGKYFTEMARIIRPGGLLVTSTDYFDEPTDTRGLEAYGTPIRVFTREDIERAFEIARQAGFSLTGPVDLACHERAVHWKEHDLRYTFIVFEMTRNAAGG